MPHADPAPATSGTAVPPRRRVPLWDNARFVCVTLVVIGHGIQRLTAHSDTSLIVYLTIYAFHMPAFAIISGYFSKGAAPNARAMRRVLTDILLPYLIMETVWTLVQFLVEGKQEFNPTKPSWTLWFLLALGIFRLVLPYLALLRRPLVISIVLAVGVSYYDNVDSTFSLARAIGILPFFVFGWRLRGWTKGSSGLVDRWLASPPSRVLLARIVAIALFAVTAVVMTVNIDAFRAADLRYWFFYDRPYDALGETQWWAGLVRLALMTAAVVLSLALVVLVPRRRTPLTAWGQSTMYVYLLHSFVLYPLRESGLLSSTESTLALVVMVVFCTVVSVLLSLGWTRTLFHRLVEPRAAWLFAPTTDDRPQRAGRADPTGSKRDRPPERP
ncbi:acyltransferase family protein [Rathayibacter tanaceti]|uniref:Acyltransferase family protein n=2 Tax=Rathayibacter tanaceti TaxID=1671680 RepID=A0A162GUE0_9MICO|nr:acyltransferase family protein [Rathayibacter tanaceti]KZX22768.1 Acyltransferase family protein [Rathayibacter tanaceti]QHC55950.1 acyltransferase family protein [Rathayibacter tanaceti]TCO39210.1 fucose 4-O-acetylase-like acetyltransferase [Rathayibacter tanaceti]